MLQIWMMLWLLFVTAENVFSADVFLLSNHAEAAQARLEAVRLAKKEIVASTYVLNNDRTALTHLALLQEAAQRGVRVILLLDAVGSKVPRSILAALARSGVHIEVFNPQVVSQYGSFLNRMHDKLLVVDSELVFIGDRNIGAEYYGFDSDLKKDKIFVSRDVLVQDPTFSVEVVDYMTRLYDHEITVPQDYFDVPEKKLDQARSLLALALAKVPDKQLARYQDWKKKYFKSEVSFMSDSPGEKSGERGTNIAILNAIRNAKRSLTIENPYIVLTEEMKEALREAYRNSGAKLRITILTNSTNSNNQPLVSGAWVKSRRFLIEELGAKVYEIKAPKPTLLQKIRHTFARANSTASLHSKVMVVDGVDSFVMSFNYDPRSANLNTEVGVKIQNPEFAEYLLSSIGRDIQKHAELVGVRGKLIKGASSCGLFLQGVSWLLHDQL